MTSSNLNTHKNRTEFVTWTGEAFERIFFLSRSVLWASFHLCVYLFALFFFLVEGGRMGVLSQNSDFHNHLLGCRSLCSKLKKNKTTSMELQCCCPRWQRAPTCRSRIVQRSLRFADWLTCLGTAWIRKSETLLGS